MAGGGGGSEFMGRLLQATDQAARTEELQS